MLVWIGCWTYPTGITGITLITGVVLELQKLAGPVVECGHPRKWHGGVLSPVDRCVYAIPCNAESVLKIFPDGCWD